MPPSISAALIKRRGIEGLSLPQLNQLFDKKGEVEKVITQFGELRESILVTERAAKICIAEANKRIADAEAAEAALAGHTTAAEADIERREGDLTTLKSELDARKEALDDEAAAHRTNVSNAAGERRRLDGELRARKEGLDLETGRLTTIETSLADEAQRVETAVADLDRQRDAVGAQRKRLAAGLDHVRELLEPAS